MGRKKPEKINRKIVNSNKEANPQQAAYNSIQSCSAEIPQQGSSTQAYLEKEVTEPTSLEVQVEHDVRNFVAIKDNICNVVHEQSTVFSKTVKDLLEQLLSYDGELQAFRNEFMKSICETQLGHNESLAEYTREHLRLMEVHEQNSGNVLREQWNQLNKEEEAKQLSGMNREVTELTIANFAIIRNIQNSLFNDFKKLASTVKKISDALFKNAYLLASKTDATASDFGTNNAEFESYKMDFIKIFYQYVVLVAKQVREYSDENNKITQVHVHDPATLWEQEVDKLKKRGPGTLLLDTANQNTEELRFVPGTLNICPWTRQESVDRIRALVANNLKEEDIESVAQKFEKLERMDTTNGNLRAVIGCGRKITDYVLIHHRLLLDQFEQTLAEIYEYNGPLKTYKQAIFINISNIYKENAKETFNFYLQCSSLAESYLDAQIARERRCEDLVPDVVKPLLEDSMKASGSSLMPNIPIYQQLPVQHNSQIPHPINNTYNMWMNRTFPPAPPTPSSTGSQSDDIKAIVLNKVGRENFDKMTVRDILKCYGNIKKATTTNK